MVDTSKITFPLFFSVWAEIQKWEIPEFHFDILKFLDDHENWENGSAVLQVFRGAGKSTLLALYITHLLVVNPKLRILVISCDHDTAIKITKDCQSIISRHPFAAHLRGAEKEWRTNRFFVMGSIDARNPSVNAKSVSSTLTSARADFVIFDDVEVPKNCRTEALRAGLRARISETTHIKIPNSGRTLFVGTPHAFISIYPEQIQNGSSSLKIPLLDHIEGEFPFYTGETPWPNLFNETTVKIRQDQCLSKGEFLSQYQLLPYAVEDSILDSALLHEYDEEIVFHVANKTRSAKIGEHDIIGVSTFWDVSLAEARSDDSVFAIVYFASDGGIFIHRTLLLKGDVDSQCKMVRAAAIEFQIPLVVIETNGVGGFVPQIMLKHVNGMGIGVDGRATTMNKVQKIIESFETPLSGGFLHIHKTVGASKFATQLRDFVPFKNNNEDDFIDSAASAINNIPILIGAGGITHENMVDNFGAGGTCVDIPDDMIKL